jgi:hypothetical protein
MKKGVEKIKRQAEREGGQILILPSENSEEVGGLSDPTLDVSLGHKDTTNLKSNKENQEKSLKTILIKVLKKTIIMIMILSIKNIKNY